MNEIPQHSLSKVVRLLWTGGWDSTFRLLQLIHCRDVFIEPYYVIDTERESTLNEIKSMNVIRNIIAQRFPHSSGHILPTKFFSMLEINPDADITDRYNRLKAVSHLGSQYDWLPRLAKQQQINELELTIHVDDKAHGFIKQCIVKRNDPITGEYYCMGPRINTNDDLQIFRFFHFPVINWSKIEMNRYCKQNGLLDVMMHTWFCFTPRNGMPCGLCNPCKYAIEEGMGFRFSKFALFRYRINFIYRAINSIKRRIMSI